MRLLFATGSPARYMAPPRLADEQIVCGPGWRDRTVGGTVVSLATPAGDYDLAAVLARLPADQAPDVVACLVDASWRNLPRNLRCFRGPKLLLVADTHHLQTPLTRMLAYARGEPFDRVVLLYDRHHLAFFHDAGLRPFWFPGLTFPHEDDAVHAARQPGRRTAVAFAGQTGGFHPRRQRLLRALERQALPLELVAGSQAEALAAYGSTTVGFNASLNGDLNLRVFEILAAGGVVLTDRLAPASGFSILWSDREAVTYADETEAIAQARHLLAHPAAARAIADAGAAWFDQHCNAAARRARFAALAFDGRATAPFELPDPAPARSRPPAQQDAWLRGYEALQDLHREREQVRVALDADAPDPIRAALTTLPRLQVVAAADSTSPVDVLVTPGGGPTAANSWSRVRALWLIDPPPGDLDFIRQRARQAGLVPLESTPTWCARPAPAPRASAAEAQTLLERGDYPEAFAAAQRALKADPRDAEAHLTLADLALEAGNTALFATLVGRIRSLPTHPVARLQALTTRATSDQPRRLVDRLVRLAALLESHGLATEALARVERILQSAPRHPEAHFLAGLCHARLGDQNRALRAFDAASFLAPEDPRPLLEIGLLYRDANRLPEAIAAFIHATIVSPSDGSAAVALAEAALAHDEPALATTALAHLPPDSPWQAAAQRLRLAGADPAPPPDDEPYDLIVCHAEITRLHGTGVLLRRFFPTPRRLITLRSSSLYDGVVEMPGRHFMFRGRGISAECRETALARLLGGRRIGRILCTPYFEADFANALALRRLTGAPLCTYVMDDQAACAPTVPAALAQSLLAASDLRLVISPEMQAAYEDRFGLPCTVVPPLVKSTHEAVPNHWIPSAAPLRAVLVGNIWSAGQFEQLRALVRAAGLTVDWFGNHRVPWLPAEPAALAREGIHCHGFVPEAELARRVAGYAFVLVPSGRLDGTEDNEWLTRLSLPSRMVFILTHTHTPMLVLGHPDTCAARFVERLGVGLASAYDPAAFAAAARRLGAPEFHAACRARAAALTPRFTHPDAGAWIWRSLAAGRPLPAPFLNVFSSPAEVPVEPLLSVS